MIDSQYFLCTARVQLNQKTSIENKTMMMITMTKVVCIVYWPTTYVFGKKKEKKNNENKETVS